MHAVMPRACAPSLVVGGAYYYTFIKGIVLDPPPSNCPAFWSKISFCSAFSLLCHAIFNIVFLYIILPLNLIVLAIFIYFLRMSRFLTKSPTFCFRQVGRYAYNRHHPVIHLADLSIMREYWYPVAC